MTRFYYVSKGVILQKQRPIRQTVFYIVSRTVLKQSSGRRTPRNAPNKSQTL
jgi:hypothetical protein